MIASDYVKLIEQKLQLLTLEHIKQLIETDQGEGFILRSLSRHLIPASADLDKLCQRYNRTWEENELYAGQNTPETDLIIWGKESSGWHLGNLTFYGTATEQEPTK